MPKIYGWNIRDRNDIRWHHHEKGERFRNESILDIRTHYKPTKTFQYTHFISSHPGTKRGFIKGEALSLLRTTSSETTFKKNLSNFKRAWSSAAALKNRYVQHYQKWASPKDSRLYNKRRESEPSVRKLKQILMQNWDLIKN